MPDADAALMTAFSRRANPSPGVAHHSKTENDTRSGYPIPQRITVPGDFAKVHNP